MNEKETLNQEISYLEETIKFLENQKDKEIWTVAEFLTNLNIKFNKTELKKSNEEPTDIKFRKANFQVKAIYDEGRKMVKGYKDELAKKWVDSKICKIDEFRLSLLEPLRENQNISSNFNESKNYPKVLNRNRILHGRDLKYPNEVNSYKAISLLLFIGTIAYDIEKGSEEMSWV